MAQDIAEMREQQEAAATATTGGVRPRLVQRLLAVGENLPAFVHDLLTTQAIVVAGTEAAAFAVDRGEDGFSLRMLAHLRPDGAAAEVREAALRAFSQLLQPCVTQGKDAAIEVGPADGSGEVQYCLATLLRSEEKIVAVTAVITRCRNVERAQQRLMPMSLVAGYFELYSMRRATEQAKLAAQNHQNVLQLASAVATADGFESAAMSLCNELATRTGAGRVSIGWVKGRDVKVRALSHTEKFDKKQELIVQLQRAMEECLDQEEAVHFDAGGEGTANVKRAHQELARRQAGGSVLSLPLRHRGGIVGVVTLEFASAGQLSEVGASGLAIAADLLAAQLYDRHENDRWLITKTAHSVQSSAKSLLGPQHMLPKLVVALVLVVLGVLVFYWPMYRVSAAFQFMPEAKRSICAPFNGQIDKLGMIDGREIRPGMAVKKGDVLLALDTFELTQKRIDALSRANSYRVEADNYRRAGKTAEEKAALARRDGAMAEAELYGYQIEHAKLTAPVDGVILKNDLRDKKGATVNQGEVLLEIADATKLRAELSVAERDVQDLLAAQTRHGGWVPGELATTSLPSRRFAFKVDRIVPLGEAREGDNYFKVYATLETTHADWLPGMAGEARIDICQKPLGWIWTHRLVDFIRLKLWI